MADVFPELFWADENHRIPQLDFHLAKALEVTNCEFS